MINAFLLIILFLNIITFSSNAAQATDKNNLTLTVLPDDFKQLNLKTVGKAKFSVLFWDIYNSTLYTKTGNYLYNNSPESLLFEIEYLKDITAEDLLERTIQQWEHLKVPELVYSKFLPALKTIWPDISSGDKLTLLVQNQQSVFYFNQMKVGQIEEVNFSKLFLDIWLSPNTSQTKLRKELLGELK
ncbi:chalcone isomerase family protein [Colwellia sp. MSW7]|uniref:Chalcone isomerase family protein n=1 Tax=Colwellia maritima TaxID=2912588 RepID=A0ABS9X6J2_9GAMM|nr:chalcone isomerase family protein [Colwellia maritima]MCI2285841.1 chalcone isomerase family protein [Colwellia maritima]